jgi:hypothetical protein
VKYVLQYVNGHAGERRFVQVIFAEIYTMIPPVTVVIVLTVIVKNA